MTEARTIEAVLPDLAALTAQSLSSPAKLPMDIAAADLEDYEICKAVVLAGLPPLQPTSPDHFHRCLMFMLAALPKRTSGDEDGQLLVVAYRRKLSHLPADAVSFLADKALERCKWFPTICECLEIASEWTRSDEQMKIYLAAKDRLSKHKHERSRAAFKALFEMTMPADAIPGAPKSARNEALRLSYIAEVDGKYSYTAEPRNVAMIAYHFTGMDLAVPLGLEFVAPGGWGLKTGEAA